MHVDRLQLNLPLNQDRLLECRGPLQGICPIYVPDGKIFAEKLIQQAHKATLHGGVGLTMVKVREQYWIPRLRQQVKRIIKRCHSCKRFQAVALATPPLGQLPLERTKGSGAFEVVGVNFAGPINYLKLSRKKGSLKRLIARRGRPSTIFSDNGRTFVGAAKLLREIRKDERLQANLAEEEIWKFNLSCAPWWGGQFEGLLGLFKLAFYKTVGGGMLSWVELSEFVLEVETQLNRRPLSYVEDDVQLPVLTSVSFLFQRANRLPELEPWREENQEKNRGQWPLGNVEQLYGGRDGVIRAVKLRTSKSILERPIQHLYPLELSCDDPENVARPTQLDAQAPVFRLRRDAALAARIRFRDMLQDEELR
ncbi:uncharacterized protein LOC122953641 [Acropora millepora]|uniref:uncharacterized protein LOC122953641 n=1 Tax=Acropora millepora TaxID=45264 RepID=UPI001CF54649|nr:uncharacterized protein LOC122953641 [Acropora millepora]